MLRSRFISDSERRPSTRVRFPRLTTSDVINDDGLCYITLDAIFAQTITTKQYQVFLQAYGDGRCFVKERKGAYFVVQGTPGLSFGWEIKSKQRDYDELRLERNDEKFIPPQQTYGEDAAQYISELYEGRIES